VRYLIIGFGFVTIPKQKQGNGILATKTKAIGMLVSDQPGTKFSLGYSSGSVISIPNDTSDAVIEVQSCSDDGITVNAIAGVKH
jgi:hypothetical protein